MYQKPTVRIIEPQQEQTSPADVTGSEASYLLAKYGYSAPIPEHPIHQDPNDGLTFEEMVDQQNKELEYQRQMEYQRRYGPKAVTFDSRNIGYSNSEFRDMNIDSRNIGYSNSEFRDMNIDGQNIGIQVQIVSDMPIQNSNRRY